MGSIRLCHGILLLRDSLRHCIVRSKVGLLVGGARRVCADALLIGLRVLVVVGRGYRPSRLVKPRRRSLSHGMVM